MSGDPRQIVVTQGSCNQCGTDTVEVYHQGFPEMRINGTSVQQAVAHLSMQLKSDLDAVSAPFHRDPVEFAIVDVRAFLSKKYVNSPAREP